MSKKHFRSIDTFIQKKASVLLALYVIRVKLCNQLRSIVFFTTALPVFSEQVSVWILIVFLASVAKTRLFFRKVNNASFIQHIQSSKRLVTSRSSTLPSDLNNQYLDKCEFLSQMCVLSPKMWYIWGVEHTLDSRKGILFMKFTVYLKQLFLHFQEVPKKWALLQVEGHWRS